MKSLFKPRLGYLLFLVTFMFFSCAPHGGSSSPAPEVSLPNRPNSQARSLLFKSDERVSYCEMIDNDPQTYSGSRDNQLEPLASLSKVITTAWAMNRLGADYRFQNEWYLKPVPGRRGIFDAYLRTNFDPVVNTEKLLYFISELSALGVLGLRDLVIDESTRVYISVLSEPHLELQSVPVTSDETKQNLMLIFNSKNWASRTQKARDRLAQWASVNKKLIRIPADFSLEQVIVKNATQVTKAIYPLQKIIFSAPLFKYLKNMNVYSNNYLADALFEAMGGASSFQDFQRDVLRAKNSELQIYTGSGLAVQLNGRKDNMGSCFSMIRILSYVRQISQKAQINLGHILLNPTRDQDGTFDSGSSFSNAVVLKTGRLFDNPAFNLAGFVSTRQGTLSFVFLGHDFDNSETAIIDQMRNQMLDNVFDHYQTTSNYLTLDEYEIFL